MHPVEADRSDARYVHCTSILQSFKLELPQCGILDSYQIRIYNIACPTCDDERARGLDLLSDAKTAVAIRGGFHGAIYVVDVPQRFRV